MRNSFLPAAFLACLANAAPAPPHGGCNAPTSYGPPNNGPPGGYGSNGTTVTIKNGSVSGVHNSFYNQDFFLGVPFAQPPVGELRFRNPQSINTTFGSALQATAYAPECIGYGGDQVGYPESEVSVGADGDGMVRG